MSTGVEARAESAPAARPTSAGRSSRRARLVLKALIAIGVVMTVYIAGTFVQVWQAAGRDGARSADAIVVLGAAQYNGRPSPALAERLSHALDLYEQGIAPVIVVTGGRQEGDRFTEATTGYNFLRERGVPDEAIRKEVQGTSTYESLAATARFLRDEGIDDVVLVSGAAHSKRLAGIASEVGLDASVSPAASSADLYQLARETVAVSAGRIFGYRRLERIDH